ESGHGDATMALSPWPALRRSRRSRRSMARESWAQCSARYGGAPVDASIIVEVLIGARRRRAIRAGATALRRRHHRGADDDHRVGERVLALQPGVPHPIARVLETLIGHSQSGFGPTISQR